MQTRPDARWYPQLWLSLALLIAGNAHAQTSSVADRLRQRIEQLLFTDQVQIEDAAIQSRKWLPEFYARRDFELAWTPEKTAEWLEWLEHIDSEGLRPEDYFLDQLRELREADANDVEAAINFDLLLTASLIRAGYDLRFGKADPTSLEPSWNLARELAPGVDAVDLMVAALAAPSLARFLAERLPRPRLYDQLKEALRQHRDIAARGGWPTVPTGSTLRPLDVDERVSALRGRLAITGDYPAPPEQSASAPLADTFDPELEAAVRRFQERHGLAADGIVGNATLAALNVPVETRIDQIRLNLERGRWVFGNLGGRFLVVNIASFQVFLVENDRPVWTARAQVGRFYRQTPIFRGELEYLVLNPTWTIPPTILREDVLPRAQADPSYLQQLDVEVLTPEGRAVDPGALDWSALSAANFPYMLRQRPGRENALGRVKFIFPNEHFVFLHDTPNARLFEQPERTFSSGCIRVEDAIGLAERVLADPSQWSRPELERTIATNQTRTVRLKEPLPVLVLYWTASVDAQGRVRFLPDIYRRDARVLAALDAPPAWAGPV